MTAGTIWHLLRRTAREFMDDRAMRLSAALAFYTALSIAPLLIVVVSVVGFAFGQKAAEGQLYAQLQEAVGPQAAGTLQSLVARSRPQEGGAWAGFIGLATLLAAATGVFSSLRDAINTVWDMDEDPSPPGGVWQLVWSRLLSLAMVCGAALLLLASLVTSAVVSGIGEYADEWLGIGAGWLRFADIAVSLTVTFGMFAMTFKVLPYRRPAWRDVWIGAALTTVLFVIGKYLIGLYLGRAAVGSTFGAAGSFVALLMWLYYSSLILLFGAEFTQVFANRDSRDKVERKAEADRGSEPPKTRPAPVPMAPAAPAETFGSSRFAAPRPSLAQVLLLLGIALISHFAGALRRTESSDGRNDRREGFRRMTRRGCTDEYERELAAADDGRV